MDGRVVGLEGLALPMPAQDHRYLARMARFVDGPEHAARRAEVLAALPTTSGLEDAALRMAAARAVGQVDVVPIAREVPVAVLGAALGVGDLTTEIGALCEKGTVHGALPRIAVTSLLFQCRDATAALITNALADGVPVQEATSVVLTRRAAGRWVLLEGAPFGAGAHACPAQEHALALARGVVSAFAEHEVEMRGPNEKRLNIRMPSSLMMRRR